MVIYKSLLCSSHIVQQAGLALSVLCYKMKFGPSRLHGASYTMAMWLLRDQKQVQVAEQGDRGGEGGYEWESEGEISSLRRMMERLEGQGEGVGVGERWGVGACKRRRQAVMKRIGGSVSDYVGDGSWTITHWCIRAHTSFISHS